MKGVAKWLLVAVAISLSAVLLTVALRRPPVYDGRPLAELLVALGSLDYRERQQAEAALRGLGPEAVPALKRALTARDTPTSLLWASLQERIFTHPPARAPRAEIRTRAAELLARLGPAALPAAPVLVNQLADQEPAAARAAESALRHIGPPVVPDLIAALHHSQPASRGLAAKLLAQRRELGDGVTNALPALVGALRDGHPLVRARAADALRALRLPQEKVIQGLTIALEDETALVRMAAAEALGELGRPAEPVIAALQQRLADADGFVRVAAAKGLWQLTGDLRLAVPVLVAALNDPDAHWRASLALREIGPAAAADAVPPLLTRLRTEVAHRPSRTPQSAAMALACMGPKAVPGLIELLREREPAVRVGAAVALAGHGSGAAAAVPALLGLLAEPDGECRLAATETLGAIGPPARDALPPLTVLAEVSTDLYQRSTAQNAVAKIRGPNPEPDHPAQ